MVDVRTRDWGPGLAAVTNLLQRRSAGLAAHEQHALAEVQAHDGTHGYGRHGYQTGWESQFVRAVTQITPDQRFDPRGLNPTVRVWNQVLTHDADGDLGLVDLFDETPDPPTADDYQTAAGSIAGGFITPDAQQVARARGEAIANSLTGAVHYAAQFRFKDTRTKLLVPLSAIAIVVPPTGNGAPYGIGFSREGPMRREFSRELVLRCIDGFQRGRTWRQAAPDLVGATRLGTPGFQVLALHKDRAITFDTLCRVFSVEPLWQRTAKVIMRRDHNAAAHTLGPWRLITIYPDGSEPGWTPSLWFSPAMKTRLDQLKQQQGQAGVPTNERVNKNTKDYHWTGRTTDVGKTQHRTYPVPAWAD